MFGDSSGSRCRDDAVIEHIDSLYSYALVLSHNRSDAEDLVQETYVRAIPAMERLRTGSNVKSWLFTILRNVWRNQLRQRRSAPPVADINIDHYSTDISAGAAKDSHSLLVRKMEREQVRGAIEQLPTEYREIILLREFEELSYQEIARVLDCPAGTVMSRLGRARTRLRKILSVARERVD